MALRALYDLPAPAKLNLFLHVNGRRADGYHLLQSVFVLIDWADRLHLVLRDDGRLARHDLGTALPDDDLCLRAARALQAASGTPLGADIHVDKQLPAGAGLGGGSSDAATTLLALNHLWRLHWPRQRLAALGLGLGADVPFFVHGRPALATGIGELLRPLPLAPAWYAVVKPPASIATREIFEHPALGRDTDPAIVEGYFESAGEAGFSLACLQGFGKNDLQAAAEDRCPEVAQAARWLESRFGNSRMTGSGSAVFARAGTGDAPMATWPADAASGALPPGWVGRLCRSLDKHPLGGWAG
ncbi:MAG: 4-(cytidine 5'-diphospho)-2-C-methyl-D-erythritol kinase [Burkholderiales bacterium]|nr:4-(cytidine 5'-diphospho)-2-C-methyl-D-erythritol kinase [Burkholderiales bacterium]